MASMASVKPSRLSSTMAWAALSGMAWAMAWLMTSLVMLATSGCQSEPPPPAVPTPAPAPSEPAAPVTNPADLEPATVMGLAAGAGRTMVITHCTACHSTALVTQNRMTRDRWDHTITWMQETQNLWPIPAEQRAAILDYLEAVQGPLALNPGVNGPPVYPPNPIW